MLQKVMNVEDGMRNTNFLPVDKYDEATALRLQECEYEEIQEIVPELFQWLQDINWPVAELVSSFLVKHANKVDDELCLILSGRDEDWKESCMIKFGFNDSICNNSLDIIRRIAENPTLQEREADLDEIAAEIVKHHS